MESTAVHERIAPEQVEAARSYQDELVPALMEEWAPRVAGAARIRPGDRVLDIACGTGVLTRSATALAGAASLVIGLDRNAGMLAVANRVAPGPRWVQGDACALPFRDDAVDVIVSQFGLMFFTDPVAALRDMMRVLAPGGRLAVAVWASLADTPAYAAEVALVERLAGRTAAEPLRAPFRLGDRARLAALCDAGGVRQAVIEQQPGRGCFPSIRRMVEADLRGWLPLMGVVLAEALIGEILSRAEVELLPFVSSGPRGVTFASPALVIAYSKPPGGRTA
jgi:SAM-dependent methyltransferase